jgi:DNA repair exonuclease SbcCD nuclease subunit
VHRHQVLSFDLEGRPLEAPVIYPGSVERTAFAEKDETKGYVVLDVRPGSPAGRARLRVDFRPLPARPMVVAEVQAGGLDATRLRARVEALLAGLPADAVLRLRVLGSPAPEARTALAASTLRDAAPSMNVDVVIVDEPRRTHPAASRRRRREAARHRETARGTGRGTPEPDLFGPARDGGTPNARRLAAQRS